MNLFSKINDLFLEAFSLRKLKPLALPLKILAFVAMLPLWVAGLLATGIYYVLAFFIAILDYPCETLISFVEGQRAKVRHATEAVVYFVAFPFIFFCKVMIALLTTLNFLVYFAATLDYFYASLGGVTWSPFLNRDVERDSTVAKADLDSGTYTVRALVAIVVGLAYLILFIVYLFKPVLPVTIAMAVVDLIILVYVPLAFRKAKEETPPPAEEEPEEKPAE